VGSKDELRKGIQRAVARLQNAAEIVRGFFADAHLTYIMACVQ
jgi:hypothetical protein